MTWDIGVFFANFADSMSKPQDYNVPISRACVMSTRRFEYLLSSFVGFGVSHWFRILVKTPSILHNSESGGFPATDSEWHLWIAFSFSGSKFLQHLESSLSMISLAKAPLENLKALFLVLLGTIVAVRY